MAEEVGTSIAFVAPENKEDKMSILIRQKNWDAVETLVGLKQPVKIPVGRKKEFWRELWNDLCSEYDSAHFYRYLTGLGIEFSPEFIKVLDRWKSDEENHARGFGKLIEICFEKNEDWIHRHLAKRSSDFSSLSWFFEDEFRLCLLLAYDELATTLSYQLDKPFYRAIGGQHLERWIDLIKADEAAHFINVLRVIKSNHRHRIGEGRAILEKSLKMDLEKKSYDGTFVLDHTGTPFTPVMLTSCVNRIAHKLGEMSVCTAI